MKIISKSTDPENHDQIRCVIDHRSLINERPVSDSVREKLQTLLIHFYQRIDRVKLESDKLKLIIQLVQTCEQLHPFIDYNCRVFCMLMFYRLLNDYGFPLSIMNNLRHLDYYSINELYTEVIEGMHHTFELIENKKLFSVDTDQVISSLQKNKRLDKYLREFKKIVSNEEHARKTPTILDRLIKKRMREE